MKEERPEEKLDCALPEPATNVEDAKTDAMGSDPRAIHA